MYLQSGDEHLWLRQLRQSFERELSPSERIAEIRQARAKDEVRLPGIFRRAGQNVVCWRGWFTPSSRLDAISA